MKLRKGLFMLCAGLSLCACSSDDETSVLDKEGAVEVTIVPPVAARALTNGSTGANNQIKVTGDMYVSLTDANGTKTKKIASSEGIKKVKFWGVTTPQKVVVKMFGGEESYASVDITSSLTKTMTYKDSSDATQTDDVTFNMQADPTNIPAYGETSTITLSTRVETEEGQSYQMYDASVQLTIPVARLEVSAKRLSASSAFAQLDLKGVYLDNIKPQGNGSFTNYKHPSDNSTTVEGQTNAILSDTHNSVIPFTAESAIAPLNNQFYAYNFYGWDGDAGSENSYKNPEVKFYFTNVTGANGNIPANQYAIIKKYKNEQGNYITLQNGKIYRIQNIELSDSNVGPVESGETIAYAVEVTVAEAVWTIETTTGEWAQ